ncbi:MAG: DUF3300 domain-containing protein [Acidobacteriia bacterium]|nr:DUF3300 domain-containing protein [Terriglobia bacterium]
MAQGEDYSYEIFSPEQLDNLLAPIALYPDPLLSQVLVAATFVDDVDEAARWVRANGVNGIDEQPWDVSVRAVAHYPSVIGRMADRIDWTTSVGQAYVNQSTDVMMSIQRLRRMAHNAGNLFTTPQQQVLIEEDYISIVPYDAAYLYVPIYDPYICYYRRPVWGLAITFSIGFLIGAWLNRDCDWHHHRIYYHGWHGRGWVERSRPRVHLSEIYVSHRYENVEVNRRIVDRHVILGNINRYNSVHRDVNYNNIRANNERINRQNHVRPPEQPARPPVNNRVMNRNMDTTNPRLDQYRGHEGAQRPERPAPAPQPQAQPRPARPAHTPPAARPAPTPPAARPTPTPPAARPAPTPRPAPHVFGRGEGNFDPRASSQRGQSSRQQMGQPRSTPRAAPAPRAQGKPAPAASGRRKP